MKYTMDIMLNVWIGIKMKIDIFQVTFGGLPHNILKIYLL
jgi:hypothetical protein